MKTPTRYVKRYMVCGPSHGLYTTPSRRLTGDLQRARIYFKAEPDARWEFIPVKVTVEVR